jgi:hypothetical protein
MNHDINNEKKTVDLYNIDADADADIHCDGSRDDNDAAAAVVVDDILFLLFLTMNYCFLSCMHDIEKRKKKKKRSKK